MQSITVSKVDLIAALEKNMGEHRDAFLKAQEAYRKAVIEVLDGELQAARQGNKVVLTRIVRLVAPSDHTGDYKRMIAMLRMDLSDRVELTENEYSCYVDDNWSWMSTFANQVQGYGVSSAKLARFTGEA